MFCLWIQQSSFKFQPLHIPSGFPFFHLISAAQLPKSIESPSLVSSLPSFQSIPHSRDVMCCRDTCEACLRLESDAKNQLISILESADWRKARSCLQSYDLETVGCFKWGPRSSGLSAAAFTNKLLYRNTDGDQRTTSKHEQVIQRTRGFLFLYCSDGKGELLIQTEIEKVVIPI